MICRLSGLILLILLVTGCTGQNSSIPGTGVVLPQLTVTPADVVASSSPLAEAPAQRAVGPGRAVIQVRISHVHDLAEILVAPGDQVTQGQPLARLKGYEGELAVDLELAKAGLAQAQAALAQARRGLTAEQERAVAAHQQTLAEADAQVRAAERRLTALGRERDRAGLRLTLAQTRTAYHRRWMEMLEPLAQHDPWNDLPFLVGVTSVDGVKRSDLNYREALAKAVYDLQVATMEEKLAQAELTDAQAELEAARQDLADAVSARERLQTTPSPPTGEDDTAALRAAVRIEELRVARAQDTLADAVVYSLVSGQVLEVLVERVDSNEATVLIRILTEVQEKER